MDTADSTDCLKRFRPAVFSSPTRERKNSAEKLRTKSVICLLSDASVRPLNGFTAAVPFLCRTFFPCSQFLLLGMCPCGMSTKVDIIEEVNSEKYRLTIRKTNQNLSTPYHYVLFFIIQSSIFILHLGAKRRTRGRLCAKKH